MIRRWSAGNEDSNRYGDALPKPVGVGVEKVARYEEGRDDVEGELAGCHGDEEDGCTGR